VKLIADHPIIKTFAAILWAASAVTLVVSLLSTIAHYWLQGSLVFLLALSVAYEWDRRKLLKRIGVLEDQVKDRPDTPSVPQSVFGATDTLNSSASVIDQPWGTEYRQELIPKNPADSQ
jgi:uncharacterized membrane protein